MPSMPRSAMSRNNLPSPSKTLSSRILLTCLLWKRLLRASMSIPMSCSMRTSCVPLRPRQDAAVLVGVASAMRSAAPSRSASVAPLLKRVRRMPRPSRKSPSGCRSRLALKSMLRSRSPSVAAVRILGPNSRMLCARPKRLPRLRTIPRSRPRRPQTRVVPVAALQVARTP